MGVAGDQDQRSCGGPPDLTPAPPADLREYQVPPRDWGYWTVLPPSFLTFGWAVLIGFVAVLSVPLSEGVTGPSPDPGHVQVVHVYESGQLVALLAVIVLLVVAAARAGRRPGIALAAWGIFLVEVVGFALLAVTAPSTP